MPNLLVTATTRYDPKGLNKAKKDIKGFDKTIKALGKTFLGLFAAQKMLSFGKASVKAFAADDKAAQILGKSLDNLGVSYANPAVKDFIATLETQTGVLDDQLRPAYQKLLTTTGDWRKSQDLLNTALDLAAMNSTDVVSVAADLSRAYAGNTRGLIKYNLGLSKTQLASMNYEQILVQIAKVSGGQAATAAGTYAGQLDKLNVAAANASETIGKGLVQALTEAGGAGGFDGALKGINDFATGISDAIIGIERLATIFGFFIYNKKGTNPITQMNEFNAKNAKTDMLQRQKFGGAAANAYIATADKNAAVKLAKQKKEELNALTAKNKATKEELQLKKDQAALDELKKKFDLERIGILAALAQATDEDTKARLRAMLAILDESAAGVKSASENLAKVMADKAIAEAVAIANLGKFTLALDGTILKSTVLNGDLELVASGLRGFKSALSTIPTTGPFQGATGFTPFPATNSGGGGGGTGPFQGATGFTSTATDAANALLAQQLSDAIKALKDAASVPKTPVIKVVTDSTVVVTAVQDAIIDNGRAGNVLFPPGSLLSPI